MEPEVHLVEKYFQEILGCFTITNLRLKGGKEIDLLATNLATGEKYHIECRVATSRGFKLRPEDTYTKTGRAHRRGLNFFAKEKFNHPAVLEKVRALFGNLNYRKVLVVWDVQDKSVVTQAKELYGIEVWFLKEILVHLTTKINTRGSRDDILRMIELVALSLEELKDVPKRRKLLEAISRQKEDSSKDSERS